LRHPCASVIFRALIKSIHSFSERIENLGYKKMDWLKSASSTFVSSLGFTQRPSKPARNSRAQEIRITMLAALDQLPNQADSERFALLNKRLSSAHDVESLWYLRSEWMGALSSIQGERAASIQLRDLDARFEGLVAKGMRSRPSRLA